MFSAAARKYSRVFLEPLARFVSATGVSPNVITVIGFLLMIGVAIVLARGHLVLGGLLIIGVAIFDAVDGTLARMMGRTSRFGAFLDSTLDRFSEAVIFLGLFVYFSGQGQDHQPELLLIYATVVGSLMVSYARARAEGIGVPLKEGLFTRFERVFILVVGLLFDQLTLALWLLAIFSNLTAIQRMYLVWRITGGEKGG
jgi:CDP-diacylglycerol---glycerol-3-phosphate 3-phosphatidyltransferase